MKTKKLVVSEDLKRDLLKIREILQNVTIEKRGLSEITGGACDGYCNLTCSYYCEETCAGSCRGVSEMGCAYKEVCVAAPQPDPYPD